MEATCYRLKKWGESSLNSEKERLSKVVRKWSSVVCEPFTAAWESREGQSSKGMELPSPKCLRVAGEGGDGAHRGGFARSVIPVIHTPLKLARL